uniref:Uncharacterized protein n=1 Tax=Arundo donax TaxID=35708 RepID=A0A0A9GU01_ARUDO
MECICFYCKEAEGYEKLRASPWLIKDARG